MLGPHSLRMAISILDFLYLAGLYPWNIGNVWFTFLLCVIVLCIMYVCMYIYMPVYGWSCTLYDGLSWLFKRLSPVMSALNLVVWLCVQGNCCKCMLMVYYVHDHRSVIVLIHVTWLTSVSSFMQHKSICLMLWRAPTHPSTSMLACAIYTGVKTYRCATRNSTRFSPWKWATSIAIFSQWNLSKNSILCAMTHLKRSTIRFPPRK